MSLLSGDGVTASDLDRVLAILAQEGSRLREVWRFDWDERHQQSAHRLRLTPDELGEVRLVAIVGGASSGKSTLFNNLLDGHRVSQVTAKGHATLGPILAAHDVQRDRVEALLRQGRLWPTLKPQHVTMDDDQLGAPDTLSIVHHDVAELRDVLLLDTPDFTSEAAKREGDLSLNLLPWFDRLVVVVDHERWFDRQTIDDLKRRSDPFHQERMAVFNRTQEGSLSAEDRGKLERQSRYLGATRALILEFRRGRGFRHFPPGTLDKVVRFIQGPVADRRDALSRFVSDGARRVLNQNEERLSRLFELIADLRQAVSRSLPKPMDCAQALMTRPEREHLDLVSRTLRLRQTREWLAQQRKTLEGLIRRVPVVGRIVPSNSTPEASAPDDADRLSLACRYFEQTVRRQMKDAQRVLHGSRFWEELKRWAPMETPTVEFSWDDALKEEVRRSAASLDAALSVWKAKVDVECQGLAPSVWNGLGFGAVGVAVVLIAFPQYAAALTLGKVALGVGVGAVAGKPLGRLVAAAREKLLNSVEFRAVERATEDFAALIDAKGRRLADDHIAQARAYVLPEEHALRDALERLCHAAEAST